MSALAGLVAVLEALRLEHGHTMRDVSRRAGFTDPTLYRDLTVRLSGPILDRINAVASVYGLRLALVPIKEGTDHAHQRDRAVRAQPADRA